ncbi:hypothetical protein CDJ04_07045 [Salmonella enterica]|uniref:DUF2726 domain-containing protein n=2 Tax=Salmonella enterica TaxID=28901 RepID=A0A633DG33_SALER|nr:hypothetical protein [Salmonella enterica]EBS0796793.1 hypothetical protein [Salmonella enterica subsp. enterica serovar Overschie]EBW2601691.1 hypothetical protein [Salmonella enterica subsp. enterica serovar Poano]EBZ5136753.1 hypothetical protein [Salmonella enterica subsp. enterica serovar Antsalova]ECD6161617.1 hypothetical protein [Salmonella enterica subsp. enterica]ECU7994269.1 hypothetical protein [Salmonella enterica subsp. enterica serovar Toucra]EDX5411671.1 hypothetical protei
MNSVFKGELITLLEHTFYAGRDKVTFDYVFAAKMKDAGLSVTRNFRVDLENGRYGYVDYLITSSDGDRCAIEVDKSHHRDRSVKKLCRLGNLGIPGFVLLRYGKEPLRYSVDGVDVIRATPFK